MAKSTLPVNYQDDILNNAMGGKRRYRMINNSDGTVSLEDVTTYDQVGSNFGAGQMNATNAAVNESADKNRVIQDIEAIRNVTEDGYIAGALALKQVDSSLGVDIKLIDGVPQWSARGADSFSPFSGGLDKLTYIYQKSVETTHDGKTGSASVSYTIDNALSYKHLLVFYVGGTNVSCTTELSVTGGNKVLESEGLSSGWRSNAGQRIWMKMAVISPTSDSCTITNKTTNQYSYTYNGTNASIIIYGL